MDQNGHQNGNTKDSDELKAEIKTELLKHFKSVDESFSSYIQGKKKVRKSLKRKINFFKFNFLETIDLSKDEFNSVSDIYDALGGILSELSNGDKSEDEINEICKNFYNIVKW